MQRKWLIPFAVCILLILVCFFRWEQGPTQTEKDLKVVHFRDRWTGQAWVKIYGKSGEKFYSGEMAPIISPNELEHRKAQILASPEESQKKQELEKRLAEAEQTMKQHDWGHAKYLEIATELRKREREKENIFFFLPLFDEERLEKFEKEIPQRFIEEHLAWIDAIKDQRKTKQELYNQLKQVELRADSELKTWAWQERKIATGIWVGLLIVSILSTIYLLKRVPKPEPKNNIQKNA